VSEIVAGERPLSFPFIAVIMAAYNEEEDIDSSLVGRALGDLKFEQNS